SRLPSASNCSSDSVTLPFIVHSTDAPVRPCRRYIGPRGTLGVTIRLAERQTSRLALNGGDMRRLSPADLREPIRLTFRRRRTRHESHRGLPRKAELAASR